MNGIEAFINKDNAMERKALSINADLDSGVVELAGVNWSLNNKDGESVVTIPEFINRCSFFGMKGSIYEGVKHVVIDTDLSMQLSLSEAFMTLTDRRDTIEIKRQIGKGVCDFRKCFASCMLDHITGIENLYTGDGVVMEQMFEHACGEGSHSIKLDTGLMENAEYMFSWARGDNMSVFIDGGTMCKCRSMFEHALFKDITLNRIEVKDARDMFKQVRCMKLDLFSIDIYSVDISGMFDYCCIDTLVLPSGGHTRKVLLEAAKSDNHAVIKNIE